MHPKLRVFLTRIWGGLFDIFRPEDSFFGDFWVKKTPIFFYKVFWEDLIFGKRLQLKLLSRIWLILIPNFVSHLSIINSIFFFKRYY